jgi:hypothetical protein
LILKAIAHALKVIEVGKGFENDEIARMKFLYALK